MKGFFMLLSLFKREATCKIIPQLSDTSTGTHTMERAELVFASMLQKEKEEENRIREKHNNGVGGKES